MESIMYVYKLLNVNQKIHSFSKRKLLKLMIPSILQSIHFWCISIRYFCILANSKILIEKNVKNMFFQKIIAEKISSHKQTQFYKENVFVENFWQHLICSYSTFSLRFEMFIKEGMIFRKIDLSFQKSKALCKINV